MKILMATMGLDIGGAETHIVELAKELKAEGHDIVVASNGGVYVPEIVAAGIRHYQVPMHRRDAGCMLRSRKLLKEIIRTERPDVVHAHARHQQVQHLLIGHVAADVLQHLSQQLPVFLHDMRSFPARVTVIRRIPPPPGSRRRQQPGWIRSPP